MKIKSTTLKILLSFHFLSQDCLAANTVPMPPKKIALIPPEDAASLIPEPIEKYAFFVKGDSSGIKFHPSNVPTYFIDNGGRMPGPEMAIGSEFKPEYIKGVGGVTFYGARETEGKKRIYWIDGRFLLPKAR